MFIEHYTLVAAFRLVLEKYEKSGKIRGISIFFSFFFQIRKRL